MISLFSYFLATLVSTNVAFAAGGAHFADKEPKVLPPANRYSGSAPIEMKNGIPFNNGTFGAQNPEYEKWASVPVLFPGINDLPYPYTWKASFIKGLEENVRFVEAAIVNWKTVTPITKPEAKEYGERAIAAMEPQLAKLKEAIRTSASSSKTDWDKTQADARHALIELRATYTSLHRNTR